MNDIRKLIATGKMELERDNPAHDFAWKDGPSSSLGICPFHGDTNQSLSVYIPKGMKGDARVRFYCFGCGKSDGIVEKKRSSHELAEALLAMNKKPLNDRQAVEWFDLDWTSPWRSSPEAVQYLRKRGVSEATADYWELRHGITPWGPVVLVPDRMKGSKTIQYQMRYLHVPENGLRYKSSPGEKRMFRTSRFRERRLVLVEGPFDALAIGPEARFLLGKVLTEAQEEGVRRIMGGDKHPVEIHVCLDGGEEEEVYAGKLVRKLMKMPGLPAKASVHLCRLPDGKDPGDIGTGIFRYSRKLHPA